MGSIPGQGTKIPQSMQAWPKKKHPTKNKNKKIQEVVFMKTKLNVLEIFNKSKSLKLISDGSGEG